MEDILKRLYNKTNDFSENELNILATEYAKTIISHESRRWVREMQSILKIKDKYFSITWDQGLTEMQENEFLYQPEEVIKSVKYIEKEFYTPTKYYNEENSSEDESYKNDKLYIKGQNDLIDYIKSECSKILTDEDRNGDNIMHA